MLLLASERAHVTSCADGQEFIALYRECFLRAVRCIYRDHLPVIEDCIGRLTCALAKQSDVRGEDQKGDANNVPHFVTNASIRPSTQMRRTVIARRIAESPVFCAASVT